ncbi:MAG: PAP2 family protein [Betaproteobacteria bacterium HGW-Betaproteobacteria-8]|nr:MAG: PAP2 family protein [Betaproteobacteria bacterium HGW-Betaproteobacteria-8]
MTARLGAPLFRRAMLVLAMSAVLMLLLGQYTDIDLLIEDYYYDEQLQAFPWLDSWFATDLMHGYVKNVIIKSGYLLLLVVAWDFIRPWSRITSFTRSRLRFVAAASLLVPTIVRGVKQFSVLHCPWTVDRYGGTEPFLRLLDHVPEGMKVGHCFPAGHATVGLWLAALCVFWLPHNPRVAVGVFSAGLSVGLVLGWVQQMRGAHFLFHTLWAAWLASLVILVMLLFAYNILNEEKAT